MYKKKSFLIVFEGVEGCGKSYQSKKLFRKLKNKNIKTLLTREPGGTKSAELIRNLILKDYFKKSKKDIRNLKVILNYEGPIVAPVQKGEKIAELIVLNKDEKIKTLPLFAHEDLKKVNFFKSLITSINYLIWGDV